MKTKIEFNQDLDKILNQLPKGAFLTVKAKDNINTMTIGWANFGIIWRKPILMVAVRKSRHTYKLISEAEDFSVSIPVENNLEKELGYCGKYSGRDIDKIKECNLTLQESNVITSPIIKECDYHYECKIVFSQFMDSKNLDASIKDLLYPCDDYHMLYFGEILDCYRR